MRPKIILILVVLLTVMSLGCDPDRPHPIADRWGCDGWNQTPTPTPTPDMGNTPTPTPDTGHGSDVTNNRLVINGKEIFISGTNVPWNNFSNDFAGEAIDKNYFTEAIIKVRAAGGNAIRVWLYTDCSYAPKFDQNGLVYAMGAKTVDNVKTLLDIAYEYGVVVDLCLLSFDMMQHGITTAHPRGKAEWSPFSLANNKKLLTTDQGIQAFIDHAVTPLVQGVKGHPAIMCWEVFNEAEGMCSETWGWTGNDNKGEFVSIQNVQKVVNRVAAAVKAADPSVLVSNGCVNPIFSSNRDGHTNYYSDEALTAAGGQPTGTLDFYMVHYYAHWQGADASPFQNKADYWGLDKPVIIGEFPLYGIKKDDAINASGVENISVKECYLGTYDNDYAGLMSWQYPAFKAEIGTRTGMSFDDPDATVGLKALYNAHEEDVKIKEYITPTNTGNSMQVQFENLDSNGAWIFKSKKADYSGASTISARFKLDGSFPSTGSIRISFVLQTGNNWSWCQSETFLTLSAGDTDWQTFTLNIYDLREHRDGSYTSNTANTADIKQVVIRAYPGNDSFTGAIIVDDVKIGNSVVSDFNDGFGMWLTPPPPPEDADVADVAVKSITSVYSE